jgi:hypothetical protein
MDSITIDVCLRPETLANPDAVEFMVLVTGSRTELQKPIIF